MTIKFYSWWTSIYSGLDEIARPHNNKATNELANELQTVLGDYELISMTSAATNGIVITTIAYEDGEEEGEEEYLDKHREIIKNEIERAK